MPLNLVKFFTPSRLFHMQPAIASSTVHFLLAIFGAMLIAAIITKIWKKKNGGDGFVRNLLERYAVMLTTLGLIGIVLTWFRYERVYIFSSRLWLLVWFVGLVTWFTYILKYQLKVIPESREKLQKSKEFNKYLPKKK